VKVLSLAQNQGNVGVIGPKKGTTNRAPHKSAP